MTDSTALPTNPEQIGKMIVSIERLNQHVSLLQSIVFGFAVNATHEQLDAVAKMLDQSVSKYTPIASSYPQNEDANRQNFEKLAAVLKKLFLEGLK